MLLLVGRWQGDCFGIKPEPTNGGKLGRRLTIPFFIQLVITELGFDAGTNPTYSGENY